MEAVAGRRRVAGEHRVPAPALDVPGDVVGLGAAGLGRDQVLLQRRDAGDPDDLEGAARAVGALGLDEEAATAAEEAGRDPAVLEDRVVEVAEDRGLARQRPGERVVRAAPRLGLGGVAAGAGRRSRRKMHRWRWLRARPRVRKRPPRRVTHAIISQDIRLNP